ncbi:MAG: hypothetical protein HGB04_03985 [Chlorobiaceae bacterium]|nr:hypothetical protein [Chlorobiaceae bacterium]
MITAELIKGQDAVQRLQGAGPRIASALEKSVLSMAIKLRNHIKENKLTGQVLHVRSETLRGSIHYETDFSGSKKMAEVGTNVVYARIHEYGGEILPKNGKYLKFKIGGQWVSVDKVVLPKRSFLMSAVRELVPEIDAALKDALNTELRKLKQA